MAKKQPYIWYQRTSNSAPIICENPDDILDIYCPEKGIRISIQTAYWVQQGGPVWHRGRKLSDTVTGWRYELYAWFGAGSGLINLNDSNRIDGYVWAGSRSYPTQKEAIRAAVSEFIRHCEQKLRSARSSNLLHYLCQPELEPFWQLWAPILEYDDFIRNCNTPKTTVLTHQLDLF